MVNVDLLVNKCTFGRKEFDLITRLKYERRTIRKHEYYTKLRTLYFYDRVHISVRNFEDMYKKVQFQNDNDASRSL